MKEKINVVLCLLNYKVAEKHDTWFSIQNIVGTILAILALIWVYTYNYSCTGTLNSDMSSELVLANLLSKQGGILSTNWIYSTELRIFNTQIVMSFLFYFLDDWSLVRALGNVILLFGLFVSGIFMLRQIGISKGNILLPLSFLLLPFSSYQYVMILVGGFYIPHLTISFLVIGFLFKLIRSRICKKKERRYIMMLGVISLIAGLGGNRYLLIIFLPLCLVGIWDFLRRVTVDNTNFRNQKYIVISFFSGTIGYLLYTYVLSEIYVFDSYSNIAFTDVNTVDLINRLELMISSALISFFGYCNNAKVFSLFGIGNICVFLYVFLVIVILIQICRQEKYAIYVKFILANIVCNSFVFLFTDLAFSSGVFVDRYWGPVLVNLFFLIPIFVEINEKKVYTDLVLVSITFSILILSIPNLLWLKNDNINKDRSESLKYLVQRELTFGYATYWNANISTELTDGKVKVASVYDFNDMKNFNYLTYKDFKEKDYFEEECFILMTSEEYEQSLTSSVISGGTKEYDDGKFVIYVYPNSKAIYELAEQ